MLTEGLFAAFARGALDFSLWGGLLGVAGNAY